MLPDACNKLIKLIINMPTICPTVTAYDPHSYRAQMEKIEPFAKRIHIDLMDGHFTPNVSPGLDQVWWPDHLMVDLHLMYQKPADHIKRLIELKPHLVIIHYEADGNLKDFAQEIKSHGIKVGLALLQATQAETAKDVMRVMDHVMVYSGNLGEHGGFADLRLLDKVAAVKDLFPNLEISWDGGINLQNAPALIEAGVEVLNVGGYIHSSSNPHRSYDELSQLINTKA